MLEEYNSLAQEMGFNVGVLNYALDVARASGTVQGVVVERYGTVAAETYAPGVPHWSLFETWSVTATVTSLLVGEVLKTGDLQNLDQTLGELLSPWNQHLDEQKAGITVRQLLTMTSGISRPYGTPEEYFEWLADEDQVAWVLDHPLRFNPGDQYYLDSAAAHLLSAVLTQVTGKSLAELAQETIMDPLGIPWADWMVDANGFNYGGFGLRIRTRDMAKIARLVLNRGVWDGVESGVAELDSGVDPPPPTPLPRLSELGVRVPLEVQHMSWPSLHLRQRIRRTDPGGVPGPRPGYRPQ